MGRVLTTEVADAHNYKYGLHFLVTDNHPQNIYYIKLANLKFFSNSTMFYHCNQSFLRNYKDMNIVSSERY